MIRRVLLWAMAGVLALVLAAAGLLYSFLSNDGIRVALEQQATAWLGQPVKIASLGAQFWPRPGVTLRQVTVGEPARLTLAEIGISTELSALLRRRIADGAIQIRNTRL
jgi:uncharacterized protein involved in outer membrane biogenesis